MGGARPLTRGMTPAGTIFQEWERPSTTGRRPFTPFPLRPLTGPETTPRRGPSRPTSPVKPPASSPAHPKPKTAGADGSDDAHDDAAGGAKLAANPWETNLNHSVARPLTAAEHLASSTPNKRFATTAPGADVIPQRVPVSAEGYVAARRKAREDMEKDGDDEGEGAEAKPRRREQPTAARPFTTALCHTQSAAGMLFQYDSKQQQFRRKKEMVAERLAQQQQQEAAAATATATAEAGEHEEQYVYEHGGDAQPQEEPPPHPNAPRPATWDPSVLPASAGAGGGET